MAINVNRVTLGANFKGYDTNYFKRIATACPASSTALADGSFLICKAGGTAWFVAPASTQIATQWAGGQYNGSSVGNKCCVSEWGVLSTCLSNRGYTPTEWFVPSVAQIQNPGFNCRSNWDVGGPNNNLYWTSGESGSTGASAVYLNNNNSYAVCKVSELGVRAFRCATY
jgi:hypothetical protein